MPDQANPTQPDRKLVDLDRLTQADVARLIGKPASYLRENAHRFERDADGRYSGRQVVAAMLASGAPVQLNDADYEIARRLAEHLGTALGRNTDLHATIRFAVAVKDRHGVAGLAALFGALLDECQLLAEIMGPLDAMESKRPTILDLAAVCMKCGAVRRGREWVKAPTPPLFEGDTCPACLKSKGL